MFSLSGGFGSLGVTSASPEVETQTPWKELLANPAEAKKSLRLLFLACGQDEAGMLAPGKKLAGLLKEKGINAVWADFPGGHVFSVWRNDLRESAPMLFRK
jgi:enterochelin esterase-like enzyme